jgi:adenylylsulfate kinase
MAGPRAPGELLIVRYEVRLSNQGTPGANAEALLIITGSMGSGKTTVMAEASDILALRGVAHAAIDLDALGMVHLPADANRSAVVDRNLHCVWENYRALGVTRLLLAAALESRADLESCRAVVGGPKTMVCRLTASMATMKQRVGLREPGMWQQKFVGRVAELNALLDRALLEDFCVTNEDRPVTDVAQEVLSRAGWL